MINNRKRLTLCWYHIHLRINMVMLYLLYPITNLTKNNDNDLIVETITGNSSLTLRFSACSGITLSK